MSDRIDLVFDLYRYQINPIKTTQLSLFGDEITFDELKEKKNQILADEILNNPPKIMYGKGEYLQKGHYNENNLYTIKLASKKYLTHHTHELEDETIEDYPFVYVMFNNNRDSQKIAISRNYKAFNNTQIAANIIEKNYGNILAKFNLTFSVTPILDRHDYWELIRQHQGRIYEMRFDLIRPNITNLSKALKEGVKELASTTNSLKTKIELNAPDNQVLENISPENEQISTLSEYSVEGGGDVSFKARGVKGRIYTSRSIRTWEVDNIQIEGKPDDVIDVFKKTIGK